MDNNNNGNGQKKNYKKRHYHHHRGNRTNNQENKQKAELVAEAALVEANDKPDTVEIAESKIVQDNSAVKENKQYNKNYKGGKRHRGKNFSDRKEEKTIKNEKDSALDETEKSELAQNTIKNETLPETAEHEQENSEFAFASEQENLDLLDNQESIPELLIIDGADGLDLIAEENNEDALVAKEGVAYEVVGVRFGSASKTYYFDPSGLNISVGNGVIVETVRGDKYGICTMRNSIVPAKNVFLPLKKVIRIATEDDKIVNEENIYLAEDAFKKCNKKITEHGLEMKLIEAAYTHDRSKLIFFFTAPTRVDFRELVKDLASLFKTRIDLRQIGIRDEAKMIGGYGICGRSLCCCSFLPNFNQVSIKMAKEQNLSLNTSKISGVCGRLMCCLKFEHKTYLDEAKLMPPVGSIVKTSDGVGEITEVSPIGGTVKVRLNENKDAMPKSYPHKDVTVIKRADTKLQEDDDEKDSAN